VMPVWGGRPRPPTCAPQFVIRPNGTAEKPALIRTSAFDLEVHCGADNEAAQKGAEYYSPGRKSSKVVIPSRPQPRLRGESLP